jgi:hypothetical protein
MADLAGGATVDGHGGGGDTLDEGSHGNHKWLGDRKAPNSDRLKREAASGLD